jgi:hypothetical protein
MMAVMVVLTAWLRMCLWRSTFFSRRRSWQQEAL